MPHTLIRFGVGLSLAAGLLMGSCGRAQSADPLLTSRTNIAALEGQRVQVEGTAAEHKICPYVDSGWDRFQVLELNHWPPEVLGRTVRVTGSIRPLVVEHTPVDEHGDRIGWFSEGTRTWILDDVVWEVVD